MPFRRTRPMLWPSRKDSTKVLAVPGTHWSPRVERENEVGCVGQGLFEHGGDAIGGNDIEPHPRTDHDTSGLCFCVAALRGNEDVDLAGDIEIVGLAHEAGVNHWRTRVAANGPAQFATIAMPYRVDNSVGLGSVSLTTINKLSPADRNRTPLSVSSCWQSWQTSAKNFLGLLVGKKSHPHVAAKRSTGREN
jgi:hypothetical protein